MSKEERPIVGSFANEVREKVQGKLEEKIVNLKESVYEAQMEDEYLDVTLDAGSSASVIAIPF